jgi:hypothetical protein
MTHRQHYLDANTRRYPRTLRQAFGPHTSEIISEPSEPFWTPVRVALTVTYALALILVVAVL